MPAVRSSLLAVSAAALTLLAGAAPAAAVCKNMGFTVNDYGKEGPTKDAKDLLDKEIAKWAAENGVTKYTVGKKTVKCELFLDVILFDEHTCTATAPVCWGESVSKPKARDAAAKSPAKEKAAEAPADSKPVETGTITEESIPTPAAPAKESATQDDAAERAAAAAERAAAAAERAAAAAEKAATSSAAPTEAASSSEPATEAAGDEQGSADDSSTPAP